MAPIVTLITRADCYLCDDAREVVESECSRAQVGWEEIDVDSDPDLVAEHGDHVPVVLVDGVVRGFWRIDADQLRDALS